MAKLDPQAFVWRKSSRSDESGCVEVAVTADLVLIRDSKNRNSAHLAFSYREWQAFLADVRQNEFDIRCTPHDDAE